MVAYVACCTANIQVFLLWHEKIILFRPFGYLPPVSAFTDCDKTWLAGRAGMPDVYTMGVAWPVA